MSTLCQAVTLLLGILHNKSTASELTSLVNFLLTLSYLVFSPFVLVSRVSVNDGGRGGGVPQEGTMADEIRTIWM
eukprot:751511-Hanusia_phi.AAC.3